MGEVRAMAFNPDGTRIVTAADDGTTRIWNTTTGKELKVIHENEARVSYVRFSSDGTKILTFSWSHNGRAKVMRADTGDLLAKLDRVASPTAISLDGKLVVTAEKDGTAYVRNIETGHMVARLIGHRSTVRYAAFSPDDKYIVTAAEDGTARIWRINTGKQLFSLKGEDGSPKFSPNGKYVVTFSQDGGGTGRARIWDTGTGREMFGVPKTLGEVTFSPDSTRIATIHSDGCSNTLPKKTLRDSTKGSETSTARLWDISTGDAISAIRFMDRLQSAAFSADGHRIAIPSSDGKIRVWKPALGEAIRTVHEEGEVDFVFLSGDDRYVISGIHEFGSFGNELVKVHVRDTVSDKPIASWPLGRISSVAISSNGARIITTTLLKQGQGKAVKGAVPADIYAPDHAAKVWDAMTGKQIASLEGDKRSVRTVAISPDGSIAVTASEDGTARIWDVATGALLHVISVSREPIITAAFFHNGAIVATGAENGTVREWDTAKGSLLKSHNGLSNSLRGQDTIVSLGVGQHKWHAVSSSQDGTIKVWDIGQGRELLRSGQGTSSYNISLDGKRFAAGFEDGAVHVWNVVTGSLILVLKPGIGYWDRALSAAFQADGTRTIRRAEDGDLIVTLAESGGYDKITAVAFSSDGERVVTGSRDGTIRIWQVPAFAGWAAVKEYSHEVMPAGLTSDERERFGIADDE
jgi:WD40 repeat protein